MTAPKRIQLRRTRGWRKPEGAIIVARPTQWGNPYRVGDLIRDPVNSVNAIAGKAFDDEPEGTWSRLAYSGDQYTVTVRRVVDAADAVALYRRLAEFDGWWAGDLRGRDLCCWCPLEGADGNRAPCHADVLLELANPEVVFPWSR